MGRALDCSRSGVAMEGILDRLSNWQIAVAALYALRGATSRQEGEEVALKCFEIAPRRFGWRSHPQLEPARVALRDAKKEKHGAFVTGDDAAGWLLTKDGLSWCETSLDGLIEGNGDRGWSALREPEARALQDLGRHRLFSEWQDGERDIALYEVADALRFTADAPAAAVRHRLEELVGASRIAGANDMEEFLEWLRLEVAS